MKALRNSILYSSVSILRSAIAFFLLPLYTSQLTTEDYGIIAVVNSIVSLLSFFFTLSLHGAISRFYYEYNDEEDKLKRLLGTIVSFVFLFSLVLGLVFFIFNAYLLSPLAKGIHFYPYLFLGLITVTLSPVYLLYQTLLQTEHNAQKYSINGLLFFIINVGFKILFILPLNLSATGVLLANALTNLLFFTHSIYQLRKKVKICVDFGYLKKALKYCLPLLPHSMSSWIMAALDKVLLNNSKSTVSAGIYNVGFQFGSLMGMLVYGFNQAYSPWLMQALSKDDKEELEQIKIFLEFIIIVFLYMSVIFIFISPFLLRFMTDKSYWEGWKVIPFIVYGNMFNLIYVIYINPVFYANSRMIPVVTFLSAGCSIILNLILIPKYGIKGAAFSNACSNLVASMVAVMMQKKYKDIGFGAFRVFLIVFLSIFCSIFVYMEFNLIITLLICFSLSFIYLFMMKILYGEGYVLMRSYIRRWRFNG